MSIYDRNKNEYILSGNLIFIKKLKAKKIDKFDISINKINNKLDKIENRLDRIENCITIQNKLKSVF